MGGDFGPEVNIPGSLAAARETGVRLILVGDEASIRKELEKRKAQAEAEEAAKKKAEDDKRAKVRAENCERAKAAKATIDSGKPLRQANAQGELIFMDEAARNAELKRAQAIIDSDCKR